MISPLLYLNYSFRININNLFPGVAQIFGTSQNNAFTGYQLQTLNQKVTTESVPENFPFNVLGNTLIYEWQVFNGTGRISWDGSTLTPTHIVIKSSNQGLDTDIIFDFSTYKWSISANFLGYPIPLVI